MASARVFQISRIFVVTLLIIQFATNAAASKLETVVLHNVNLDSRPLNSSIWENEGFEKANATQISTTLGKAECISLRDYEKYHYNIALISSEKVNSASTAFLMARKSAKLYTILKKFDYNFLSIKFSSLIGKKVNMPFVKEATTTTTTTTTETPSGLMAMPISVGVGSTLIQVESESGSMSVSAGRIPGNESAVTSHIIEIEVNQDKSKQARRRRKRRELDSQEISQIHEIIKVANANKDKELSPVQSSNDTIILPTVHSNSDKTLQINVTPQTPPPTSLVPGAEAVMPKSILTSEAQPEHHDDSRLYYKAWRSSKTIKNFRPPGFYVLINDEVIFDSWEGLWENPNVMGKWYLNKTSKIWNETELLIRWDEAPVRNIKVSFEWEPMDSSSFFFLDDISIGTIGAKAIPPAVVQIPDSPLPVPVVAPPSANSNSNITLYIVVKGHTPEVATNSVQQVTSQNSSEAPNPITASESKVTETTTTTTSTTPSTTTSASTTTLPTTTPTEVVSKKPNYPDLTKKGNKDFDRPISGRTSTGSDITAIIVLAVVVTLCVAILLTVICNRFQGAKRLRLCRGTC